MSKKEIIEWMRAEFLKGRPAKEVFTQARTEFINHSTTPLNYGAYPDPRASERKWQVFSTALCEGWLMLECTSTGAEGVVKDPTSEEWSKAFTAPSSPIPWHDKSRVVLMKEGE